MNLAMIQVNTTLQWQAVNSAGTVLGTTSLDINGLNPGESRPFETTGFVSSDNVVACSQIASFNLQQTTITRA